MTVEIDSPIDITKQNNEKTQENIVLNAQREEYDNVSFTQTKGKKPATEAQKKGLEKARQAKQIKRKALQMMDLQAQPAKHITSPKNREVKDTQYPLDISSNISSLTDTIKEYTLPILCALGITGLYLAKKKNMTTNSENTAENVTSYSTLQLGF